MDYGNFKNPHLNARKFCSERFRKCRSLYRKNLFGHFGCVNAVEFSHDGQWLVSGGDDRRVLLWNVNKATRKIVAGNHQMKTEHMSNIFCTVFDNEAKFVFSAGNDEDVVRHDINRQEAVGHYSHEEAVYCVALPSDNSDIFATAGECGAVFIWDVRAQEAEQVCVAMSTGSFHGVAFNPYESQLVVTANAHDGVSLYDIRKPEKPLIIYGVSGQRESAMFARFDQFGTRVLALMRRAGPVLYNIGEKKRLIEFSHPEYRNVCTLKSPCFVGDADQFIAAGSDDFNIYLWKNPRTDVSGDCLDEPAMVLKGHRSIVNQIRYNYHSQMLASSGVEKVIKLWSQFKMEGCTGYLQEKDSETRRQFYSHEEYMQLIVESGEPLSHDYGMRSVDEDPRMIAFFDSLIQRVNTGWFSDESSDDESPIDEVLLQLAYRASELTEDNEEARSSPNIHDLLRIFRPNRARLAAEGSDRQAESSAPSLLNRRLRRLLVNEVVTLNDEVDSESSTESEPDAATDRPIQPDSDECIRNLFQSKTALESDAARPTSGKSPRAGSKIETFGSNNSDQCSSSCSYSEPIQGTSETKNDSSMRLCQCRNRKWLKDNDQLDKDRSSCALLRRPHSASSMTKNNFASLNHKEDGANCNCCSVDCFEPGEGPSKSNEDCPFAVSREARAIDHCLCCDRCREKVTTHWNDRETGSACSEAGNRSQSILLDRERNPNNNSVCSADQASNDNHTSSTRTSEDCSQSCATTTALDQIKLSYQPRTKRPLSSEPHLGNDDDSVESVEPRKDMPNSSHENQQQANPDEQQSFRRRDGCQKRKYRKHDD